jgi:hypothetical protein
MVNGLESTVLILIRLSEMMHTSTSPTIKELSAIQESLRIRFYSATSSWTVRIYRS